MFGFNNNALSLWEFYEQSFFVVTDASSEQEKKPVFLLFKDKLIQVGIFIHPFCVILAVEINIYNQASFYTTQ